MTQPGNPPLASRLGFRVEHVHEYRDDREVPGLRQPGHHLLRRDRQAKRGEERGHLLGGGGDRGRQHRPPPTNSAS